MRTLYAGAGLALTAGLLMGAAMKPNLSADDRPAGPQIFAGWSGTRSTGPFDDTGSAYAAYGGHVPEYVTGTDWKVLASAATAIPQPRVEQDQEADAPPIDAGPVADVGDYHPAVYVEREAEPAPGYPSMAGGADIKPAHIAARAEAAAPRRSDLEPEAPPEATGDTTIAER